LFNAGHISAIDIINVGANEGGVLWNAYALRTPGSTLPDGSPIGASSTITDIGVINATNLINQGTISNIDVAINVSYLLWNDFTGVLDGFSSEHVQWIYLDDPTEQMHGGALFRTTYDLVPGDRETRADLRVGRATTADPVWGLEANPLEELLGVPDLGGIGIVNYGTITNFETIFSMGDVINFGNIGTALTYTLDPPGLFPVPPTVLTRGGVTSLVVGSNGPGGGANFFNFGVLDNVSNVRVHGDILLGEGTQLIGVGTIAAQNDVFVEGRVDGGFRVMNAETGGLFVRGLDPLSTLLLETGTLAVVGFSDEVTGNLVVDLVDLSEMTNRELNEVVFGGLVLRDMAGTTSETVVGSLTIDPRSVDQRSLRSVVPLGVSVASGASGVENLGIILNNGLLNSGGATANYGFIANIGLMGSEGNIRNYGLILNRGRVDSGLSIINEGTIYNAGTMSSYNNFVNWGTVAGNGTVTSNLFRNETTGTVAGSLTIHGHFINHGTIALERGDIIRVVDSRATIVGGTVDVSEFRGAVVGGQYLFLATDNPGDLVIDSRRTLTATGSGEAGSVLDFIPVFGSRNGTQYVAGEVWARDNQFYWLEVKRAYQYGPQARTANQIAIGEYIDRVSSTVKHDFGADSDRHRSRPTGLWNMLAMLDGISDGYFNVNGTDARDIREERRDPNRPVVFDPHFADHQGPINPAALRALDEMSGTIYANLGAASVHNYGAIHRTLADVLRSDVFKFSMIGNPNNAIRGQAIAPLRYTRWGTVFGIGGSSSHDGNADGYRTSFGGVMAGVDRAAWTGTRVGAYLSAAAGDVSMRDLNEKSDITSVSVGMYLRQEMFYGYGLVSAGFGTDWYKTKRNLDMIRHRAESRTHAMIGTVYLERGIDIPVYYATVQPYASFQVVSVHQDRFTETMWNQFGNRADVGLEGVEGKTNSFKLGLGTRASSQPIPMRWGQLALTGNMAWFHDFQGKNDRDFIARFSNRGDRNFDSRSSDDTFTIYGNDPKRDWFNFGIGLNMDRNSTRIFLGADLFSNSRQAMFTGNGGFVTSW